MKFLIILIITSFLFLNKKDSIDLKKIELMLKNNKTKSIDSTNMKINLNSGIDMNFITIFKKFIFVNNLKIS